jgi:RNA polymerase sigma factor (sigma-70 family)
MWNRLQDVAVRGSVASTECQLTELAGREATDPQPDNREEIISEAISKLPLEKQEVIKMRLEGLQFEEIGERLDISKNAAEIRWRSALEELRDAAR